MGRQRSLLAQANGYRRRLRHPAIPTQFASVRRSLRVGPICVPPFGNLLNQCNLEALAGYDGAAIREQRGRHPWRRDRRQLGSDGRTRRSHNGRQNRKPKQGASHNRQAAHPRSDRLRRWLYTRLMRESPRQAVHMFVGSHFAAPVTVSTGVQATERGSRRLSDLAAAAPGDRDHRWPRRHAGLKSGQRVAGFSNVAGIACGSSSSASPGCWTATNRVSSSGVNAGPHSSAPTGTRKNSFEVPRSAPSVSSAHTPSARPVLLGRCRRSRSTAGPAVSIAQLSGMPNQPFCVVSAEKRRADFGDRRIAALDQDRPRRTVRRVIAVGRRHLDDMAELVVGARIGGVDLLCRALVVVGQQRRRPCCVTGLASTSSGRSILVAPSRSAASRVSISTSAWLAKPFALGQRSLSMHQRQPVDAAVGIVARDRQRAVIEEVAIGAADWRDRLVPSVTKR